MFFLGRLLYLLKVFVELWDMFITCKLHVLGYLWLFRVCHLRELERFVHRHHGRLHRHEVGELVERHGQLCKMLLGLHVAL